jgi:vacuolar-type H+-ATPase subunit I/STV1
LVESLIGTSLSVLVAHVVLSVSSLSSVELHHDKLDDLEHFGLVKEICVEASHVLLFMVLEVSLVSGFFLLNLSYFLKFVVVYVQGLAVEWLLRNLLLG